MIKAKHIYLASALTMTLALVGCSNDSADKAENTATPAGQMMEGAPHAMQVAEPVADDALTGTIIETFDSGGYTYLQLDNGQDKIWAAIGQAKVEKGQKISLANGPVMKDFHSPSLNRTFAEIIFSSGVKGGMMAAPTVSTDGSGEANFMANLSAGGQAPAMDGAAASGGSSKAIVSAKEIQVAKAEGETGRTVEQVFAEADKLNGQKVKVRGKVVKVSPGIMGVNWLHLQDGSGNPMKNSHDLVVTTDELAEVDSVVVVEGTVASKKDFGMGYYYDALVEKAVISK
ncbi:MAG: DNA-binding protein [Proteobacteria bacterium]|nr:DNA-binding protein [Pseudomonadota bacterium]MBU1641320.1 DNA-binding protein [Pseudomonadota bacterium]